MSGFSTYHPTPFSNRKTKLTTMSNFIFQKNTQKRERKRNKGQAPKSM
jgi:hypothetical protein